MKGAQFLMSEYCTEKKKLFLISVTDEEDTLNRKFQEVMLDLFNTVGPFCDEYDIVPHNRLYNENLYESIDEAIVSNNYEGYIVILDCLDTQKGLCNPNVMFEFGAIKYLKKPFVVIAANADEVFPFDVRNLNRETIPTSVIQYTKNRWKKQERSEIQKYLYSDFHSELPQQIEDFLYNTYKKYKISFNKRGLQTSDEIKRVDNSEILNEIKEIKKLISNTAQYIEGEAAAFTALHEAVKTAKSSLRTTRFANQTIVADDSLNEQNDFMNSLYETSSYLKENFSRIICNNHPLKWNDIYNILFYGGNGSKIFIRKEDYSIHFELVVIDERIAFIHFYQADRNRKNEKNDNNVTIEKINSTLKIEGKSICKKLANIFDRLHHRDFEVSKPEDPSRTLLGIPTGDENWIEMYKDNGCFVLDDSIPKRMPYSDNRVRRRCIIEMFKNAFQTWKFDIHDDTSSMSNEYINKDKVNMVVGIALVENKIDYIEEMKDTKLTLKEYQKAKELYEALC